MAINLVDDMPAVSLEPGRRIVGKPAVDRPVNADAVVIIDTN